MNYIGDFSQDAPVHVKFSTVNANGAPVAPSSAFTATDFRIYKGSTVSYKTTVAGITVTSPFDGTVGRHHLTIDTSVDTGDIGFWASGFDYFVEINSDKTVDEQIQSGIEICSFSIENRRDTAASHASAVRAELATELSRIDATISSRATPNAVFDNVEAVLADYEVATVNDLPSPVQMAQAVRTNLATELARIDDQITSRVDFSTIYDLQMNIPSASTISNTVWTRSVRTLSSYADSPGISTLLARVVGLLRTKSEDDNTDAAILERLPISGRAATAAEVSPTINFDPEVSAISVSSESIDAIRDGLATSQNVADSEQSVLSAVGIASTPRPISFGGTPRVAIGDLGARRVTWPSPSKTITGTIQWQSQVEKPITGAIVFSETVDGVHFYDWQYDPADRPTDASWGIIRLTDGEFEDAPLLVQFVTAPMVDTEDVVTAVTEEIERDGGMLDRVRSVLAGITRLSSWLRAIMRSDAADAIAMGEINTGGGTYSPIASSLEANSAAVLGRFTGGISYSILVTNTSTGEPLQGATVTCRYNSQFETQITEADGLATFTVLTGLYDFRVLLNGYAGVSLSAVSVSKDDQLTVPLVPITFPSTAPPEVCPTLVRAIKLDGQPLVGARVHAEIRTNRLYTPTAIVWPDAVVASSPTNAAGEAMLQLLRSQEFADGLKQYTITVTHKGRNTSVDFTTPAEGPAIVPVTVRFPT